MALVCTNLIIILVSDRYAKEYNPRVLSNKLHLLNNISVIRVKSVFFFVSVLNLCINIYSVS